MKNHPIIILLALIVILGACSTEDEVSPGLVVETTISNDQQIMPTPLTELEAQADNTKNNDLKNDKLSTRVVEGEMNAWFNSPNDNSSFFYEEGNEVLEEANGKVIFRFNVWRRDSNYTYFADYSRNIYFAFPIYKPGEYTSTYIWDHTNSRWSTWRQFRYVASASTDCFYDTVAPTVNSEKCSFSDGAFSCNRLYHYGNFPVAYSISMFSLEHFIQLEDNCDREYSIIRQWPPKGTIINGPTSFMAEVTVSDVRGNEIDITYPNEYKHD